MQSLLLALFAIFPLLVPAQENPGPRISAMGGEGSALTGIWALTRNSAGLAAVQQTQLAVSYEQSMMEDPVTTKSMVLAVPVSGSVVGVMVESYGFSSYNELVSGIALAKAFGRLGISVIGKYHQTTVPSYGKLSSFAVAAGLQFDLSDHVRLATQVRNPAGGVHPTSLTLGMAYFPSDQFTLIADVINDLGSSMNVRMGAEYQARRRLFLRVGSSVIPFKQFAGLGFKFGNLEIDCAVSWHSLLGYTPQMGLAYEF